MNPEGLAHTPYQKERCGEEKERRRDSVRHHPSCSAAGYLLGPAPHVQKSQLVRGLHPLNAGDNPQWVSTGCLLQSGFSCAPEFPGKGGVPNTW